MRSCCCSLVLSVLLCLTVLTSLGLNVMFAMHGMKVDTEIMNLHRRLSSIEHNMAQMDEYARHCLVSVANVRESLDARDVEIANQLHELHTAMAEETSRSDMRRTTESEIPVFHLVPEKRSWFW